MTNQIERFLVAIETIAAALSNPQTVVTTSAKAAPVITKAAPATEDPKPTAEEKAAQKAAKAAEDKAAKAAAKAAEAAAAEAEEANKFDYETLKKAIIELASSGPAGKDAALRILTDAGLEKGQKASDAAPAKWPAMYDEAVAALDDIKAGEDMA